MNPKLKKKLVRKICRVMEGHFWDCDRSESTASYSVRIKSLVKVYFNFRANN